MGTKDARISRAVGLVIKALDRSRSQEERDELTREALICLAGLGEE